MRYAHDYVIKFTVYSDNQNECEITGEEIYQALRDRVANWNPASRMTYALYEATYDYETGEYTNQEEA